MFDVREFEEEIWPECLMQIGYGGHYYELESYEDWFERTATKLNHLHPEICEQWIFRHWFQSSFSFIPLEGLTWREERWCPEKFLHLVSALDRRAFDPDNDYNESQGVGGVKTDTALALDNGEWDYAPILIETPNGSINEIGQESPEPYLLIEGHKRRRYLNALVSRGVELIDQRVFIIKLPPIL